jgi:hypothetical protein
MGGDGEALRHRGLKSSARVPFWREIRRSRSKKIEAPSRAIIVLEERGPDTQKLGKPGASR